MENFIFCAVHFRWLSNHVNQSNLQRLDKNQKNYKLCIKMQFLSVLLNITKIIIFWWRNASLSRTQRSYHMIYKFFGSTLGKV